MDDLKTYQEGFRLVLEALRVEQVPEVGMNVALAPAGARSPDDVMGLAGRICLAGRTGRFAVAGAPERGAPGHTGRIALALTEFEAGPWWVLNHRFSESFLERARAASLDLQEFDRASQPQEETSTVEWGTRHVLQRGRKVPDGVFDRGAWGKEPMIRLFAKSAPDLARKLKALQP